MSFILDRHFPPDFSVHIRPLFLILREHRIGPFRDLDLDPPMDETELPLRIVRSEGLSIDRNGFHCVDDSHGAIVLQLPSRQHVYGIKLHYEARPPAYDPTLFSMVSWDPDGTMPPRSGYGMVENLHPSNEPIDTLIFVDRETDTLRIDLVQTGAAIRIHGLALLTPRR